MSSDKVFVDFVLEQIEDAGRITSRKMFGEYGIYCNDKFVAAICDSQFFVKPTQAGRAFIGEPVEAPPYPGAKMYFLIEDQLEEREWVSALIRITAEELPIPAPKVKRLKKEAHE